MFCTAIYDATLPHHLPILSGFSSLFCNVSFGPHLLAQALPEFLQYKTSRVESILIINPTPNIHPFSNHILTMKFITSTILSLAALFSVASAGPTPSTYTVRYNTFYDSALTSLNDVACSNGDNGLVTKGYSSFVSLPSYPFVGGVFAVENWNSPECGSCWELTYEGSTIYVTAIDTNSDGFDISLAAMTVLTKGQAQQLDSISVQANEVASTYCY